MKSGSSICLLRSPPLFSPHLASGGHFAPRHLQKRADQEQHDDGKIVGGYFEEWGYLLRRSQCREPAAQWSG